MGEAHIYAVDITRDFDPGQLTAPGAEELANGEEDGLAGNQHYRDLRGASWDDVADVLTCEAEAFTRFAAASDLDEEAEQFDEERLGFMEPEDLWGLDVGVAGAALALAALGAIPVGSCNAGGFGGHHQARFPYVAFFIGQASPQAVLGIAAEVDIGLDIIDPGIGRLFAKGDHDLHRFGRRALDRHRNSG